MPTMEELNELLSECTWTKTKQNGESVCRVTGTNGRYIFLPYDYYSSEYWSCSLMKKQPVYMIIDVPKHGKNYINILDNYVSNVKKFYVRPVCTIQE